MTGKTANDPDWPAYMRPHEAAQYLRLSSSKLAKLRMRQTRGQGPRFIKLAGVVLYRRADLDAWLEANAVEVRHD